MPTGVDVVVIGAGIQGLSVACALAMRGIRNVTVLDHFDRAGRGSSGRSGSMLMKSRENAMKVELSLYSYRKFMEFGEEYGQSIKFRKTGFLSAVTANLADRYECEHQLRVAMGVPSEKLTPDEVGELAPGVRTEDLVFGVHCPDDGEIDAVEIMKILEETGRRLGVNYAFSERATGIEVTSGRVSSVRTTRRNIPCGHVVNAAGENAKEVASWVGARLPIDNRVRSLYIGQSNHDQFQKGPMVEDAEVEWYYRGLGSGRVLIGMGREADGSASDQPNVEYLPEVRAAARRRAPLLAEFTLVGGTSGVRPLTPDLLPIIGPVPQAVGYINCCGWGGEGIMHSPAGGRIVADWISGDPSPFDRNLLLASRFNSFNKTNTEEYRSDL